jgi:hypothetical protein
MIPEAVQSAYPPHVGSPPFPDLAHPALSHHQGEIARPAGCDRERVFHLRNEQSSVQPSGGKPLAANDFASALISKGIPAAFG